MVSSEVIGVDQANLLSHRLKFVQDARWGRVPLCQTVREMNTADELVVTLADGRRIATPLAWYPRLREAGTAARGRFELMPMGIHWPELDEDLGIAGMLQGRPGA
jgi:hypothetical protein